MEGWLKRNTSGQGELGRKNSLTPSFDNAFLKWRNRFTKHRNINGKKKHNYFTLYYYMYKHSLIF